MVPRGVEPPARTTYGEQDDERQPSSAGIIVFWKTPSGLIRRIRSRTGDGELRSKHAPGRRTRAGHAELVL